MRNMNTIMQRNLVELCNAVDLKAIKSITGCNTIQYNVDSTKIGSPDEEIKSISLSNTVEVGCLHTLRLESLKLVFSTTPQISC